MLNSVKQRQAWVVALILVCVFHLFLPAQISSREREVSATQEKEQEKQTSFFEPLTTMIKWVGTVGGLITTEVSNIDRRKLRRRLLILNDHLSSLETSKRLLNQSLMDSSPDAERLEQNLNRLRSDISKVRDEVATIRSTIQIMQGPQGAELERQLTDALMLRAQTVEDILRRMKLANQGQPIDLDALRKDSEQTIGLIHKAQDAVIALSEKLKG